VLIDEVIPGKHVNVRYQATITAGSGNLVIEAMEQTWKQYKSCISVPEFFLSQEITSPLVNVSGCPTPILIAS
jgi:Ni,Fe-hydrogenase I small subunit